MNKGAYSSLKLTKLLSKNWCGWKMKFPSWCATKRNEPYIPSGFLHKKKKQRFTFSNHISKFLASPTTFPVPSFSRTTLSPSCDGLRVKAFIWRVEHKVPRPEKKLNPTQQAQLFVFFNEKPLGIFGFFGLMFVCFWGCRGFKTVILGCCHGGDSGERIT